VSSQPPDKEIRSDVPTPVLKPPATVATPPKAVVLPVKMEPVSEAGGEEDTEIPLEPQTQALPSISAAEVEKTSKPPVETQGPRPMVSAMVAEALQSENQRLQN